MAKSSGRTEAHSLARQLLALLASEYPALLNVPLPELIERFSPCRHGPDFASVIWFCFPYTFTATQAKVVEILWHAWVDGTGDVGQAVLLEAAGSVCSRLAPIFKGSPAWGTMIQSRAKGTFYLAEPPPG